MCEKTESKKACLKCEVEESREVFNKTLNNNSSKLCEMFDYLFKKYQLENNI